MTTISRSLLVVLLALLCVGSAPAVEEVLDGIAAVVNKDVVTFSQVRELVAPREMALRESLRGKELVDQVKALRLAAINDLIDRQLVLQEFEKNKFAIPDFVINDHITTIIREQFNGDRQTFIRTLQAQGFTLQRFRKVETDKLIVQAMRSRSVKVNTILSPASIEQYYRDHIADYSTPEQIKLRMIVIRKEPAQATAEEIAGKIKNGDDFGEMARLYSEDSTKDSGGDWGWIDRKTLDTALSDPAFALKVGKVSKPIALNGGVYLLYVEARRKADSKPLSAVRDQVIEKIQQSDRQAAQEKWIKGLRDKAYVRIF
jgi:peptidyl-prolyl cis-trans isomerase SurA